MAIIFVQMWLRWTLPRPRIDQVLYACVKVLLPLSCVLLLGAAVWGLLVPGRPGVPFVDYANPFTIAAWRDGPEGNATLSYVTQWLLTLLGLGGFLAVVGWVLYAAITGRNLKQRLTDPAPIAEAAEVASA